MPRTNLALAAVCVAGLSLLGACSSGDSSDPASGAASPSTLADDASGAPSTIEAGSVSSGDGIDETLDVAATLPDPCVALTAEEFTAASGVTVAAEIDLSGGCSYADADGNEVALLVVSTAALPRSLAQGFLDYPPPSATYTEVPGIGELAVVGQPPEGRAILILDGSGFDLNKGFGSDPLDATQLEAALRSIAAT